MNINILTLFPKMFSGPFSESIIKRAQQKGIVKINIVNLRDFAVDKHKSVDDTPCGGGPGMVLRVDVIDRAIKSITKNNRRNYHVVLATPQGKPYCQKIANKLSTEKNLLFICGHYEGFDERIRQHLVDEEISLGDFVLSGGEVPVMAIVDSVVRLLPGALGKDASSQEESFSMTQGDNILLEYPNYTKPVEYRGWKVPETLLSGDHQKISDWRRNEAIRNTKTKRPDLLNQTLI